MGYFCEGTVRTFIEYLAARRVSKIGVVSIVSGYIYSRQQESEDRRFLLIRGGEGDQNR